jgi:hypothetical protein
LSWHKNDLFLLLQVFPAKERRHKKKLEKKKTFCSSSFSPTPIKAAKNRGKEVLLPTRRTKVSFLMRCVFIPFSFERFADFERRRRKIFFVSKPVDPRLRFCTNVKTS